MKKTMMIPLMLTAVLIFGAALPALAQTADLELVGSAAGLILNPSNGQLFDLGNLNPGDTKTACIDIRNDYSSWYDLFMQVKEENDSAGPSLLEKLELTVTHKGTVIYEGPLKGFAGKPIELGRYRPRDNERLCFTVHLPGPETGNEYQGQSANVKWVFTAQGQKSSGGGDDPDPRPKPDPKPDPEPDPPVEVPDPEIPEGPVDPPAPPVEPPIEVPGDEVPAGPPPEMPKTGQAAQTPFYLLGGLAVLAGAQVVRSRKEK